MKTIKLFMCGFVLCLSAGTAFAASFTVDAKSNSSTGGSGLSTGISFLSGELFTVTVALTDLWNAGPLPRWSDANGLDGNLFATGLDESGQSSGTQIGQSFGLYPQGGLSAPYGALVGRLSSTFFLLGTNFSGPVPAAGTLELYYWDSNNSDNSGSVVADVQKSTQPVPEPGTMMLMGIGLFGFAVYGKRRMNNTES